MYETESDGDRESETIAKLKFCKKRHKKAPVSVTEFTNGRVSSDGLNSIKFERFKSIDDGGKINVEAKRCLQANNGRLTYTGTPICENTCMQYFVGARDKKTGTMRLYDTKLFRMKPKLDTIANINLTNDSVATPEKSYKESMQELTASFGSKGRKRAMNSMLKNAVPESVLNDSFNLENIPNSISETSKDQDNAQSISYMPSKNLQAMCVQDVFDMNEIISSHELDALKKEANSLLSIPEELSTKVCSFCNYVKAHFDAGITDFPKILYLIYYNYLITFQHLKYADIRKKDPVPNIPEPFKSKLLSTFTTDVKSETGRKSRSFPQQMKDKLLAHILVLALHIDDFNVNISSVLNDLNKIAAPKFTTIAQALGCHISNVNRNAEAHKFAVLKIPLYVMPTKYIKKSAFGK